LAYELYNLQGVILKKGKIKKKISLYEIEDGIYYLKLIDLDSQHSISKTIIKF